MERINEKKCPKCGSEDVVDTGNRIGEAAEMKPNKDIPEPNEPMYKCNKCGEYFVYLGN